MRECRKKNYIDKPRAGASLPLLSSFFSLSLPYSLWFSCGLCPGDPRIPKCRPKASVSILVTNSQLPFSFFFFSFISSSLVSSFFLFFVPCLICSGTARQHPFVFGFVQLDWTFLILTSSSPHLHGPTL